ncbi:hypothetical protein [Streptomyces caniferus]|uniref:hypothetical protein n=1 Tax=Streptomyces caniferus TaxID=285557 RepID=UPI0038233BB8
MHQLDPHRTHLAGASLRRSASAAPAAKGQMYRASSYSGPNGTRVLVATVAFSQTNDSPP